MRNSQSITTSDVVTASATRQSTLVSAKDIDPKAVTWNDVTVGDRPSNKPGEVGQMVKAALTICGLDTILFSTEQLRTICGVFKLTGYQSKPKADLLRIIGVGKVHQSLYDASDPSSGKSDGKAPAKTRNCMFRLINILFFDEISPKFEQLGARKDKSVLDSGLAGNTNTFGRRLPKSIRKKMMIMIFWLMIMLFLMASILQ